MFSVKITYLKSKLVRNALSPIARIVGITGLLGLGGCTVFDTNWISAFFSQNTAPVRQAIYIDTKTGTVETVTLPTKAKTASAEDKQIPDIPREATSHAESAPDIKIASKEKMAEVTTSPPKSLAPKKAAPLTETVSTPVKISSPKAKQQCCKNTGIWTANPRDHNTLRKLLFSWSLAAGYKLHWGEGELNNTDFTYTTPFKLNGDFQTVVKQLLASRNLDPQLVPHFYTANRQLVIRPGKGVVN